MMGVRRLIWVLSSILCVHGHCFPQMMSHGYSSCVACHEAPTGGGMMTAYGRSLSKEILSQYGEEGEEKFLYGAVNTPEWLSFGGDIRFLQSYVDNERVTMGRFFPMQADVELGVITPSVQVVGSVGYQSSRSSNFSGSNLFSRRHYVQYTNGDGLFVRAGKFEVAYGIRWPDHYMLHRRDLGWNEGSEAYRLEWTQQTEKWESVAAVSMGRPESPTLDIERNASVRVGYFLGPSSAAYLSGYYGNNSQGSRAVFGPSAAVTLIDKLMAFAQWDFQKNLGGRADAFGFTEYTRLNYELFKGLHLQATQEFSKLDFASSQTTQAYGVGAQWFARPHIEVAGVVRKSILSGQLRSVTDSAFLLLHYYL